MSRFMRDPPDVYRAAVKALEKLLQEEDLDYVERAAAEVISEGRLDKLKRWGYKIKTSTPCLARVLGSRSCPHSYYRPSHHIPHRAPGDDHVYLLQDEEGNFLYQSQPYHLSFENMQKLVTLCNKHGLRVDISAGRSWHFPGHTIEVEIQKERT